MMTLYPVVRRVRRPLLVQDTPPVVAGSVEPVKVEAAAEMNAAPSAESEASNDTKTVDQGESLY
jgi:hypothetical protein